MPGPKLRVRSPLQRRLQAANENPAQADLPSDHAAALRAAIEPRPAPVRGRAAQKAAAVRAIDLESELMHELQSSFDSIRRPFEPFQGEPAVAEGLEDPYAGYADGPGEPVAPPVERFASDAFADDPFTEMNLRGGPPPPPAPADRFAGDQFADDAFSELDADGGPPPPPAPGDRFARPLAHDPFSGMSLRGGPPPPPAPRLPQVGAWVLPQAADLPAEPDLPVDDPLGIEDFDWQGSDEIEPVAIGRAASPRFQQAAPVDPRHYAAAHEHDVMRFGAVAEEEEDTGLFRPDDAIDPDAPDQGYAMPLGDYRAQERRATRRSGRATLMMGAVVALALAGGAGALALSRSDGSPMVGSGPPRLITADASPTKIVPEAVASTGAKVFLDPLEANTGLALAPPSELVTELPQSPADVAANDAISQIILPPGASPAPVANAAATADATGSSLTPRVVRTLVVRPDGTVLSSGTVPAATDSTAARLAAASAVPNATGLPARPVEVSPITTGSIQPTAAASTPVPAPAPVAAPQPAPAPVQVAAVQPSTAGRIVVTPGQSGFVVSLVSHRTEAQAAASYAELQRRYPSLLGNREASILPANLGERGIYYRVRVGPVVASQSEAQGFCNQLKAAGQDCFVVTN